eukprot:365748-Chlamydomonas_euryale.AAC.11
MAAYDDAQVDKNVEREILNHRVLKHPNIIAFKEVRGRLRAGRGRGTRGVLPHLLCHHSSSSCERRVVNVPHRAAPTDIQSTSRPVAVFSAAGAPDADAPGHCNGVCCRGRAL